MRYIRVLFVVVVFLLFLGATAVAATEPVPQVAKPDFILYGPPQAEFNQAMAEIQFDTADHLAPGAEKALEQNVKWLQDHPNQNFYIGGYADWREDVLYNMTLSQKRADVVKARLIQMGIAPQRILFAVGWGKLYPVCVETTDDCFQRNRRVRLSYAPSGADTAEAKK